MGDLRWIKITTDIFDDEKMLVIENRPDADEMIIMWFKLLCLAGKKSNRGDFTIGGKPYTEELFSIVFRRPKDTVKRALDLFESLGMITRERGIVAIKNWKKHQSVDELEYTRAQTRARVARYRERQKAEASTEAKIPPKNANVTQCNAECNALEKNREDKSRIEESRIEENRVDESRAAESSLTSPSASLPPKTAAREEKVDFTDSAYAFGELIDRYSESDDRNARQSFQHIGDNHANQNVQYVSDNNAPSACGGGILRPGIPVTDEFDESDIPPEDDGWFFAPSPKDYFQDERSLTREHESERPRLGDDDCRERGEPENLAPWKNSYEPRNFTEKTDKSQVYKPREEQRAETPADRDSYHPKEQKSNAQWEQEKSASEAMKPVSGNGRGVVMLNDWQAARLKEKLGAELYEAYLDRLSSFIIEKRARIKNHFETILKWYEEDKRDGVVEARIRAEKRAKQEKSPPRYGSFDPDEAFRHALARSFADIAAE